MAMNGIDSLKRHQKCMRLATSALTRAAMARAKNKTKAKRAEVKAAAVQVARVACAVTIGTQRKKKSMRPKKSPRSAHYPPAFMPDFARQHASPKERYDFEAF